jgi:hypothetical protein
MHAFLDSAVIAREGGRSSNRQTIITGCPAFAGHDKVDIAVARGERTGGSGPRAKKYFQKKFLSTPVSAMCSSCLNRVTAVALMCICCTIVRRLHTTRHKIFFCMIRAHARHLASALACANESRYTPVKKSKKRKRLDHNRWSC